MPETDMMQIVDFLNSQFVWMLGFVCVGLVQCQCKSYLAKFQHVNKPDFTLYVPLSEFMYDSLKRIIERKNVWVG